MRTFTMLLSFMLGKLVAGPFQPPSTLMKLPMLMVRKVVQLFMLSFGALLVGVIGIGLFLREIIVQLQTDGQVIFSASMGISLLVAVVSWIGCAVVFKKSQWLDADDLKVDGERPVTDVSSLLTRVLAGYLEEKSYQKADRRARDFQRDEAADYSQRTASAEGQGVANVH